MTLPVSLTPGTAWQIAAAADDQHFVVAVPGYGTRTLTLLGLALSRTGQLTLDGQRATAWNGDVFRGLALSPDGAQAAVSFTDSVKVTGSVAVVNLRTGQTKTWSGAQAPGFQPGDLSFVNGTGLAMPWIHYLSPSDVVLTGIRELNVAGPGGSLLASRLTTFRTPSAVPDSAIVAGHGAQLITSSCSVTGRTMTAQVAELSAFDGRLIRVLRTETQPASAPASVPASAGVQQLGFVTCPLLSVDATGLHILTEAFTFGQLDGGRFRQLPADAAEFDAAW